LQLEPFYIKNKVLVKVKEVLKCLHKSSPQLLHCKLRFNIAAMKKPQTSQSERRV